MRDQDNWDARPRRRWGRRILAALVLLFIGLIAARAIWSWSAQRDLQKLMAGYRAAGEPTTPAELENAFVPDADNAVIEIQAAMALLNPNTAAMKQFDKVQLGYPFTTKERAAIYPALEENAAVFPLMEAAMAKPGFDWKLSVKSPVLHVFLPSLSSVRALSILLGAAALASHEQGDDATAVRHIREMLFLAKAVDRHPTFLVSHFVAVGIRAIACACAERIAPDLQIASPSTSTTRPAAVAQVKLLIAEMFDETEMHDGFRRGMLAERVMVVDTAESILSGRLSLSSISTGSGSGRSTGSVAVREYLLSPLLVADTALLVRADTTTAGAVEEKNFPAAAARVQHLGDEVLSHRVRHFYAAIMMRSYEGMVRTHYRQLAESRLAVLSLAVRRFAVDHEGRFPDSLSALVPAYLPAVPLDPFAADDLAMRYLTSEPDPRLYSVGENGADEGGSSAPLRAGHPANDRWKSMDAVLHLHRPDRDPMEIGQDMRD